MNKVFLIGNLTRDPELTETSGGVSVCRFSIAVNRNYAGGDGERKVDFFNCVAWRGLGETVARFAKKGNKVAVSGSVELRQYDDNQGVRRTSVDIVAQDIDFLTPRTNGGAQQGDESTSSPDKYRNYFQPMIGDDDGDIPF